jgi:hypothetical protein
VSRSLFAFLSLVLLFIEQGILKLEQQVLEVHALFQDLATLVDLQQESLDVISNRISQAGSVTLLFLRSLHLLKNIKHFLFFLRCFAVPTHSFFPVFFFFLSYRTVL